MKFTDGPKWKRTILAAICLLGLAAMAGRSFAAYTSQASKRGVARNRDSETIRFTSNYLQSCTYSENAESKSFATRVISFDATEENISINLNIYNYVYNYAGGNNNLISQRDISYDLRISFSGGAGSGYSVMDGITPYQGQTEYTITGKTLTGRTAKFHNYTIIFPGSDLDKVKITVVAIPKNPSITNNQMLAAVLTPSRGAATSTFSFEGKFIYDTEDEKATPETYDGFNYEISISSGEADAVLIWDPAVLEIDQFFLINNGFNVEKDGEKNKISFTMNQPAGTGDYLIPFYIKSKTAIEGKSWSDMENLISFTATQKQA